MPHCQFTKSNGSPCGRSYRAADVEGNTFTACAKHRSSASDFKPCSGCGEFTRSAYSPDGRPMCTRKGCGLTFYQVSYKRQRRARELKAATARIEAAKREHEAQEMGAFVEELLADFDPASVMPAPSLPPAAWEALGDNARAELMAWFLKTAGGADRTPPTTNHASEIGAVAAVPAC